MQNKSKKLILAGCLAASVATAGLTGCHTEDRTAGRYMDDRRIASRVESNLKSDPVYKYRDVHVNVFEGVAQLSGFVDTHQQVGNAASIASRTEGVREVINDITLKPEFKIVPTNPQASGRRYEATGATGAASGTSTGTETGNAPEYNGYKATTGQAAPVIKGNPNAAWQGSQQQQQPQQQQQNNESNQ